MHVRVLTAVLGLLGSADGIHGLGRVVFAVLGLTVVFLVGLLYGAVLKRRDFACVIWFPGLLALVGWIMQPRSAVSICVAAVVLATGLILMARYYRGRGRTDAGHNG